MLKAIILEDEPLAALQMNRMLEAIPGIEVAGSYSDPDEAIAKAEGLQPDVAFLDIHLPGKSGIQAAELLQEVCPELDIVFVTAYDKYAVHAFDLNAIDYVLKPLHKERLLKTVQRLTDKAQFFRRAREDDSSRSMRIRLLQTIQFERRNGTVERLKWRTAKAQELFAYLIHHRGQAVRKSDLQEMFWPDLEAKKASAHLYTTIYHIRQALKDTGTDIGIRSMNIKEGYILDAGDIRIDSEEWERDLTRLEAVHTGNAAEHRKMLDLYPGDFLADCDYLWAENERQRLRILWIEHARKLGEFYAGLGQVNEAILIYNRMQEKYPHFEGSYFPLMKLYASLRDRKAVEDQFNRLCALLKEMDVLPEVSVQMWMEKWREGAAIVL
ncbi:response regulator [Paenibacillus chitinolyticus]|uniref:response regulator n=1 Tax=Paenibacillus chitinolyticus TaxID=79263 RepID=UPI00355634A7